MILVVSPGLLIFTGFPVAGAIALLIIVILLVWVVDSLTMRLVVAGKWRGLRGYEV